MLTLTELATFLHSAHCPQVRERRPTFFSIAGFPHYENVLSNVYQFFFSTESPHGLGSLCVDALLDVVEEAKKRNEQPWQRPSLRRISVEREVSTKNELSDKRGRLDLLLHDGLEESQWKNASTVILIENKVYHWLANNLDYYWEFIKKENPTDNKLGIVLGLKRESIPEQWQNKWIAITHLEWAQAIEMRIGAIIYHAEPRYVTLLLELIENIRSMSAIENFQPLQFFERNRAAIFQAEQVREEAFSQFPEALRQSLPEYEMKGSKAESTQGWLAIYRQGSNRFKYILGYRELFYEGKKTPTYRIQLVGAAASGEAKKIQQSILSNNCLRHNYFEISDANLHHVLTKTYQLPLGNNMPLHQLIVASLRTDWQPLEHYWLEERSE